MKKRTTVSATDLRVRLGEMLRRLEGEDLVIEKGGIPVAVLSRYERGSGWAEAKGDERMMSESDFLERIAEIRARAAASKGTTSAKPDDDAWADAMAAIREGWSIDGDELKANIRRWRRDGASTRYYEFDGDEIIRRDAGDDDGGRISDRQRRVHRRDVGERLVADRGDTEYNA